MKYSIEELRALEKAATPGPWHLHEGDLVDEHHEDIYWAEDDAPDLKVILAARNAFPDLLDLLEEAGKLIEASLEPLVIAGDREVYTQARAFLAKLNAEEKE